MRAVRRVSVFALQVMVGAEPYEIDKLEDADRVQDKYGDKPLLLTIFSGVPEGITFYGHRPDREQDKEGQEEKHEREEYAGNG